MNRTENDLRRMYDDQPDADYLERRVLDWIENPSHVEGSTGASWAKAVAAAAAVAALTAGIVSVVPHGTDSYSPGSSGGAMPAASAPMPAVSVATPTATSNIRFAGFTRAGELIPAGKRQLAGPVAGPLLGGGQYSLASDAGHVVVLNFFATWCRPCQSESPAFQALSRQRGASGVKFVGVDVKDGTLLASRAWLADKGITFPIIWDQPGDTAVTLGNVPIDGLPLTVLVDEQQRVAAVYGGMVTTANLARALDQLAVSGIASLQPRR